MRLAFAFSALLAALAFASPAPEAHDKNRPVSTKTKTVMSTRVSTSTRFSTKYSTKYGTKTSTVVKTSWKHHPPPPPKTIVKTQTKYLPGPPITVTKKKTVSFTESTTLTELTTFTSSTTFTSTSTSTATTTSTTTQVTTVTTTTTVTAPTPRCPLPSQVLRNPSFETTIPPIGSSANWVFQGYQFSSFSQGYSGLNSPPLDGNNIIQFGIDRFMDISHGPTLSQAVRVCSGEKYSLSIWIRTSLNSNPNRLPYVRVSWNNMETVGQQIEQSTALEWVEVTGSVIVHQGEDVEVGILQVQASSPTPGDRFAQFPWTHLWIDKLSFTRA